MIKLLLLPIIILTVLISLFYVICLGKLFTKAEQPFWKAFVPILNIITYFMIIKSILLLPIIVVLSIIFAFISNIYNDIALIGSIVCLVLVTLLSIVCHFRLYKAFGKEILFTILAIPFGFITIPILAFGNSQYIYSESPENISEEETNEQHNEMEDNNVSNEDIEENQEMEINNEQLEQDANNEDDEFEDQIFENTVETNNQQNEQINANNSEEIELINDEEEISLD